MLDHLLYWVLPWAWVLGGLLVSNWSFDDIAFAHHAKLREERIVEEFKVAPWDSRKDEPWQKLALRPDGLILAIKEYRYVYGVGLREAKDAVDKFRAENRVRL